MSCSSFEYICPVCQAVRPLNTTCCELSSNQTPEPQPSRPPSSSDSSTESPEDAQQPSEDQNAAAYALWKEVMTPYTAEHFDSIEKFKEKVAIVRGETVSGYSQSSKDEIRRIYLFLRMMPHSS